MKKQKTKAFTLVELIVVISILAILTTIWFMNYSWNISNTRNSARVSNLQNLKSALKSYKQDKSIYPIPWDSFEITNSWMIVAKQWFIKESISLSNMDYIPKDPYKDDYYVYSRFKNLEKMQLAATIESKADPYKALVVWDYFSVSKDVLPTIILAKSSPAWTQIEIHDWIWDWSDNRKLFIYNNNIHNLPYDYGSWEPISDWTSFNDLLSEVESLKDFYQNTSYETCNQIKEAWEAISSWYTETYQVRKTDWTLTNTGCTF